VRGFEPPTPTSRTPATPPFAWQKIQERQYLSSQVGPVRGRWSPKRYPFRGTELVTDRPARVVPSRPSVSPRQSRGERVHKRQDSASVAHAQAANSVAQRRIPPRGTPRSALGNTTTVASRLLQGLLRATNSHPHLSLRLRLARFVALVSLPRVHQTRYHGVLAPGSAPWAAGADPRRPPSANPI